MSRQKVLVEYWTRTLDLDPARVRHVLLLPEGLATGGVTYPVVTWEQVLEEYRVVGPANWVGVLATALERHAALVSPPITFGKNAEAHMSGQQIVAANAEGTLPFGFVGRSGVEPGPESRGVESVHGIRWPPFPSRDSASGAIPYRPLHQAGHCARTRRS